MIDLLKLQPYALEDEATMNKPLILLHFFTNLTILTRDMELELPAQS